MRINGKIVTDDQRKAAVDRLKFTDKEMELGGRRDELLCESVGIGWTGDYGEDKPGSFAYESRREDDLYLLAKLSKVAERSGFKSVAESLSVYESLRKTEASRSTVSAAKARADMRKFWKAILNA